MLSGLRTLFGLAGLLTSLWNIFQRWKMRREVTQEVVTEIQKKEDEFAKRATEVVAAERPDTDAANKLSKGVF